MLVRDKKFHAVHRAVLLPTIVVAWFLATNPPLARSQEELDFLFEPGSSRASDSEAERGGQGSEPAPPERASASEPQSSDRGDVSEGFVSKAPPESETPSSTELREGSAPVPRRGPIEEVVVTGARQREESLQDVPVAVSSLDREQLERLNASTLKKIAEMTPQLFIAEQSNGNGGTLTIRGIGSSSTTSGFEQAVSMYVDGLQYSRGNVLQQGYFDLDRVEVLKGPQALFFGKNNSAGVVSMTTAGPGDELELIGRVGTEFRAEEHWGEAIASGPLLESLGGRLAIRYSHLGSFVKNLAPATTDAGTGDTIPAAKRDWPNRDEFLGRLTFRWDPTDDLDVTLKVSGSTLSTDGATQQNEIVSCPAFNGRSTFDAGENCKPDWRVRNNDVPPVVAATEPILNEEGGRLYSKFHSYSVGAQANWDFGLAKLTSISGLTFYDTDYLGDYDFTATSLIFAAEEATSRNISQELRLLTQLDVPVTAMLGFYYQKTKFDFRNLARVAPNPVDPLANRYVTWDRFSGTDGETYSPFVQLLWDATDTIELAGGFRFTYESKDSFAVHDYLHPLTAATFRPVGDRLTDRSSNSNVSPEATVTWRPNLIDDAGLTLYAAYKEGFKSGGFSNSAILTNQTVVADAVFAPESVTGFEGGIKSTWLDDTLVLNVVGYRYTFEDLQVNFFDSSAINFTVQNAASATTTGSELELRWRTPLAGLRLNGSASYNIGRYDEFLSFCYAGQPSGAGCNLDANGNPSIPGERQDLSGTARPMAPEWTAGIGFDYELVLPQNLVFGIGADTGFVDNYTPSALGFPILQDSYFRSNASLRVLTEDGRWEIAAFGRNLSNEYVFQEAVDVPLTGQGAGLPDGISGDEGVVHSRPRELGIQFIARF